MMLFLLLSFVLTPDAYADPGFEAWKVAYIKKAAQVGIPRSLSSKVLKEIALDTEAIEKSKNQITSSSKDYPTFIKKWLRENPSRIEEGRQQLKKHQALLEQVEKRYGVEKEVIVALWGVETFYGRITGDHDLIRALASLAYRSHRKRFYEIQLNATFRLLIKGHAKRSELKGSWAGATGQLQLMPSNFNMHATDFDGDGRKNIWTDLGDTFASIANFLKKTGWKKGESIGRLLPASEKEKLSPTTPVAEITLVNSPYVVKGPNYESIMVWNKSSLFAAFVLILLDGFTERSP